MKCEKFMNILTPLEKNLTNMLMEEKFVGTDRSKTNPFNWRFVHTYRINVYTDKHTSFLHFSRTID